MADHFAELTRLLPALSRYPRAPLFDAPSALEAMPRLGARLGIDLDVKRDDALPLAMGGNKIRQLEWYMGEAVAAGADTVLITGAVQSNFVRLCAAAARKYGMQPICQLEDRVPKDDVFYNTSGNVLLLKMLGAEIIRFPEGEDEAAADANLDLLADRLRSEGRKPYVVHLGIDHPPVGGLGYAAGAAELMAQYEAAGFMPDHVVIGSGSALSHAGFLAGARAIGWTVPITGICVRRDRDLQKARVIRRAREVAALLDCPDAIGDDDVCVDDTVFPPGYGRMNDAVAEAITLSAHEEALILDPVYTGRAMAGLIHLVRSGVIAPGKRACFIHTGGTPAIFAYQNDLPLG